MPVREKTEKGRVRGQPVRFSGPNARADRRKTARLFASSPGVQCRDRLRAGGSRIRTLSPTCGRGSLCGERDGNNGSSTGGSQVRTRLAAGGSRIRTLGPGTRARDEPLRPSFRLSTTRLMARERANDASNPQRSSAADHSAARHCQLKQGWYPPAVGGAAVRCREVFGTPVGLPPSRERGAKKVDSTELSLTMPRQMPTRLP